MKNNVFAGTAVLILCAAITAFSVYVYRERDIPDKISEAQHMPDVQGVEYPSYIVTSDETVTIQINPSEEAASAGNLYPGSLVGFVEDAENGWAHIYEKNSDIMGYVRKDSIEPSAFEYNFSDINVVDTSSAVYSYEEMKKDIEMLSKKYDAFFGSTIGKSEDGREIYKVSVGNAPKKVLFIGGISGTDYITSQILMKQAEYYAHYINEGTYSGYKYADLIQNVSFDIVPMLNPDGISINQFGPDILVSDTLRGKVKDTFYSDTANGYTNSVKTTYYTSWKANANGVDISRNFPSGFDSAPTVKTGSCAGFKGLSPLSEAESKAAAELLAGNYCAVIIYTADGSDITYSENMQSDAVYGVAETFAKEVAWRTNYLVNSRDSISGKSGSLLLYCADQGILSAQLGMKISGSVSKSKDIPEPWAKLRELPIFLSKKFI